MKLALLSLFKKYENLVNMVETVFNNVRKEYSSCIHCQIGCSDCCHALFDLSLIEALYINHHFKRLYSGKQKKLLLERANRIDRRIYRLKRKAHQSYQNGKTDIEILNDLAMERARCPLLNENDRCEMYEFRPITCRLYGIPTSIAGKAHTCGLSGFDEGTAYPTVSMDAIHQKLFLLSTEFVNQIQSKYIKLPELLVPLSMALLTDYDENYLGIIKDENTETR